MAYELDQEYDYEEEINSFTPAQGVTTAKKIQQDMYLNKKDNKRRVFRHIRRNLAKYEQVTACLYNKYQIENEINNQIQILFDDAELFWSYMANTKDIMSYKFTTRRFSPDKASQPQSIKVQVEPDEIIKTKKKTIDVKVTECSASDYDIKETSTLFREDYIDEADKLYRPLKVYQYYEIVRKDEIEFIFSKLYEFKFYSSILALFCALACNKEFCHLIFNKNVLDYLFDKSKYYRENYDESNKVNYSVPFLDNNYLPIIYRCLFCAFYIMYKEECVLKTWANDYHRFVIELDDVLSLPLIHEPIEHNPYIPLTLSSEYLRGDNINPNSYLTKHIEENSYRGPYSKQSFWKRFHVFSDGIFQGLDMNKVSFTGSVISACLYRNPLEKLFGIELLPENDHDHYHDKYWDEHEENLINYFDEYYPSKNIIPKDELDYLTPDLIDKVEDCLSDIDIVVNVNNNDDFDRITYEIFQTIYDNLKARYGAIHENDLMLKKILTGTYYKYYVSGLLIKRSVEIFRFFGNTLVGGVSRFHHPPVRAVTKGNNVYMLPSSISYAFTGYCLDYKWVAVDSEPRNIALKYYTRGAQLILNKSEQEELEDYVINSDYWKPILKYIRAGDSISVNNPIFKPRQLNTCLYKQVENLLSLSIEEKPDRYNYVVERKPPKGISAELRQPSGHIYSVTKTEIISYVEMLKKSRQYNQI